MNAGLYLESINLRNFATFENQEIFFNKSFNGIVGETGSGKSLILDAFQLVLGARSDKKLVRKGTECAIVEGHFKVSNLRIKNYFNELGFPLEEDDTAIIKRVIYSNGKSKSFLNHMSCPLSVLTSFSKTFVDMVGQFENQKLGSSEYQLYLLDQYSNVQKPLDKYSSLFSIYKEKVSQLTSLESRSLEKKQREDYIRFQLEELTNLEPSKEREAELVCAKNQLLNKDTLTRELDSLKEISSEGETNILALLRLASKIVRDNESLFGKNLLEQIEGISSSFEDFSYEINMKELDENDELNLEEVLEELDRYQKLKRKFSVNTEELKELYKGFQDEIEELNKLDKSLAVLREEISSLENQLYKMATDLHTTRLEGAEKLDKEITKGLSDLNMEGASFRIVLNKLETLGPTGLSKAVFTAETNPGEGFHKIKEIASGGELSRILLTLRQIVASEDSISIFFFDEIDTGIGGETALKIANALKKVSIKGQVLAITHLPQIAKAVDEIIFVDKKSFKSDDQLRTVSFVENKIGKEREKVIKTLAGL